MTPTPLVAWIEGVGFLAPGLPDWNPAGSGAPDDGADPADLSPTTSRPSAGEPVASSS